MNSCCRRRRPTLCAATGRLQHKAQCASPRVQPGRAWAPMALVLAILAIHAGATLASQPANQTAGPPEQLGQAQALTAPNNQHQPKLDACKDQTRTHLQLTNLSQIQFQPTELCSTWSKMLRFEPQADADAPAPWLAIERLDLSHNNLSLLQDSNGLSRLVNLLELRITHNKLARCEETALAGLQRLQTLDLSHNKLMALPAKFFQSLRFTLKKLVLSYNSVAVLVPNLFDQLNQLEYLDLSHNEITSHWINDFLFKNLTQLRYLDLSFNKLTVFSSPLTFSSLLQLETLSLQHNELRQVPETIQYLRYLSSLDLSQNFIHDVTNASYLSNCRLLFNLNLEANLLENITRDALSDLPALKVLNLASNRIHHLDQQAFEYVPDLHALRLDSNRLIDFGQAFVNLRFLLMLNISSNRISSFDYAQIPLGLQWLDLHSNKIDKLNNFYYSPTAQQSYANDISSQQSSISQQWQSVLRLTTLDASFNLIKELDNTSLPESLETVQLNNNHIRNIASHTFSTKSNLTRINLSHNRLSTMPFEALKLKSNRDTTTLGAATAGHQLALLPNGQQKFVDIYLANNPFVCNCNMGWLSQLLLASSTLLPGNNPSGSGGSSANGFLREHQLILARQLPRVADAHFISCHLPFARQQSAAVDQAVWSPVLAATQLALQHNSHTRDTPLIQRQSELLASVHLCPYKSHCFALCYCCDFDACDCEMSCPENCSCYYDQTWSTNIVDCGANNQLNSKLIHHQSQKSIGQPIKFLNIPDKIPMDVTELYLDGLELLHLRGNALIGRKNLKSLFLNNSQLYSIEPKALATQKALKVLQLNSNYLTELHGHEFEQQVELRELYLAYNHLTNVANTTFAPLKSLQILHLHHNQLFQLNFWSNLPTGHKLISVSLGTNPWSCQCDQVEPMLQWLHLNIKHIHDKRAVSCQYNRTTAMHLLKPSVPALPAGYASDAAVSSVENDSPKLFEPTQAGELQYQMFDMRMCLNFTVYPIIQLPTTSPSPLTQSIQSHTSGMVEESSDSSSLRFKEPSSTEDLANGSNSFGSGLLQPPNDEPFIIPSTARPSSYHQTGLQDHVAAHGYQLPPVNPRASLVSSPFLLGATSMILLLVIMILSLIHYRRPMGMWFHSHYGLNMFSAASAKSHHHKHHSVSAGSLANKHHAHLHHHHHQCGASSTGSTSSSSAASSNMSQTLCQQQTNSNATSSGLVTTPLIVSSSNNHQLLSHQAAASSLYSDDEKLYDAYLTYSRLDEQFINDFIAPELEFGQPSYRIALHYRDLPVTTSEFLTDCIIETANASRRVIMVLSEQLLKSEWTQYEFRAAHLEALRSNYRHRLIVIMVGQTTDLLNQLDADLVQWLKGCTCIQWADKMFWQRLRFAMPELPPNRQLKQQQYLRYQTHAPHQQHQSSPMALDNAKQKLNLGANLLKSAGGFLGNIAGQQQQHARQSQQQQISSLHRPLPDQPTPSQPGNMMLHGGEQHHYAHLTPATMIYNQQPHTYHQPIYGDPQQQLQHQQDNSTAPVHI